MKKTELMQLSEGLSRLYTGLETDLIANIAEYLKKGNINSSTAQWKIQMLSTLGALDKANIKTIAEYAKLSPDILTDTLETASLTAIEELEPGFQALVEQGIIEGTEVPIEKTMARSLKTYNKQAVNSLNMVNTVMRYKAKQIAQKAINDTAEFAEKQSYLDMLSKAAGKVVTGQESRQIAMRQCIKEMSDKGIPAFVDKSGREWSPEAYINMDIRTTSSNVAHQSQFDRMDDYGIDLIQTSSHAGARPKCSKDQGKIFNRNGSGGETTDLHGNKIRYYAWKDSSYGEPDGILGINCGHHIYPFVPGVSIQRYFPYDEEENDKLYKQIQQQRELERRVRKSKRECMALDTLGDTEGLEKASVTLKQRQQALKQYCADNGLSYKADRTAVVGYNKSISAKVNSINRNSSPDVAPPSNTSSRTFRTKSELDKMSLSQLRSETKTLAQEYYKSGKSGISFGGADTDEVAEKLTANASRTSLTKDYMSMKKKPDSVDKSDESGIIKARGDSVAELYELGHLDTQPLEKEFGRLKTDEIIVTNERINHIKERHPQDYALFEKYGRLTVESPDLILKDSEHKNTVFMVKHLDKTNLNVVARLILESDEKNYKNSVMTFYRIRDKNLKKLEKKNITLYKNE